MSEFVIQLVKSKKGAQAGGVLLMGLGVVLVISLISHSALDYPNSSRLVAESFNWGANRRLRVLWRLCNHGTVRLCLALAGTVLGLEQVAISAACTCRLSQYRAFGNGNPL